jgi:phosphopantetheinyl transferase (holo-ACP synthase)
MDMIGNDVVDLRYFESPAYTHVRYLDRVCSPGEARAVRRSDLPARSLAIVWAAKEAAFKLISQKFGRAHFVPRDFVAALHHQELDTGADFTMSSGGVSSRISVTTNECWVHAVATLPGDYFLRWRVEEMSGYCSSNAAARAESQAVRHLARKLLDESGREGVLEFFGRVPRVKKASTASETVISLSHHGAYVAAAIAWRSEGRRGTPDGQLAFRGGIMMGGKCSTCMA